MILILFKNYTIGLNSDANIIKNAILLNDPTSDCKISTISDFLKLKNKQPIKFDTKILLENIEPDSMKIKSKKTIFVPNPEFLSDWGAELLSDIDIILCKSKFCQKYFREILKIENTLPKPKLIYTKFTSQRFLAKQKKNYNLACHFAGSSFMKNTKLLLKYWLQNDGFVKVNSKLTLLATLKQSHLTKPINQFIKQNFVKIIVKNLLGCKLRTPITIHKCKNIIIVDYLPIDLYNFFRATAGYFICPSSVEGYGHYINEGRIAGAITLTTNHAPMNEIIQTPETLLKVSNIKAFGKTFPFIAYSYNTNYPVVEFSNQEFKKVFTGLLKMSEAARKKIIKKNKLAFAKDTVFFNKAVAKLKL